MSELVNNRDLNHCKHNSNRYNFDLFCKGKNKSVIKFMCLMVRFQCTDLRLTLGQLDTFCIGKRKRMFRPCKCLFRTRYILGTRHDQQRADDTFLFYTPNIQCILLHLFHHCIDRWGKIDIEDHQSHCLPLNLNILVDKVLLLLCLLFNKGTMRLENILRHLYRQDRQDRTDRIDRTE